MTEKNRIHTGALIIAVIAVFALCLAAALVLRLAKPGGALARITLNGEILCEIDLSGIDEERQMVIETEEGFNVVAVRRGAIRVVDADCPDRLCVNRGWLTGGYMPIVCLPHRLVIELIQGGDPAAPDAISG